MDAVEQLLDNEKGIVAVGLIIGAVILCAVGVMPVAMWQEFAFKIFGVYAATTAVHASAVALASRGKAVAPAKPTADDPTT